MAPSHTMRRMKDVTRLPMVARCLLALALGLALPLNDCLSAAKDQTIRSMRLWTAPDHTRLVLDLSGPVLYNLFRLSDPDRVVIDIDHARMESTSDALALPDPVVRSVRHGKLKSGVLRLVLDVKEAVQPRSFLLKPMQGKPHRLVVDLVRQVPTPQAVMTADDMLTGKQVVIAVDAGHGGEDPGAIGRSGLKEKTVTLAVAKALAKAIDNAPGMRAVLIRKGDYFVPLGKRVALARKAKADLMISIHADAVKNRHVLGASAYTLSEKGASDHMARLLADKENASDAIGGAMPDEVPDPMVNSILADLIKRDSINNALLLADEILTELGGLAPLKYKTPKRARFVVLGAPEIPSVLVELDYISNPARERKLRSGKHQRKLAAVLLTASENYLRRQGLLARKTPSYHIVRRGDSLWSIARHYGISMSNLRSANSLRSVDMLRVGDRLRLPST
ncbi:MAG: N-acetylmuramoyl-L-alanine amidase [Mariprofundaceae bacterium]